MFKIVKHPTFQHEVKIEVPVDGGHETQSILCTYRILPNDELAAFDTKTNEGQKDFLRAVIASLDDLVDENDQPLSYNDALRDQLLNLFYVRLPLLDHYTAAMIRGRAGN